MFVFIAVLTILGFIGGFLVGRKYTEREVKIIEEAKSKNTSDK